ncbi:metallophosphoesterase [Phycisphaerales bacterium AB-hyl4]|uniref:Metallophosphoesterase n=1 Tax=Natronomicrosphaera hydrolytica TaxID=3242702 RepID=A0ABV4U8E0_9BACT
MRIAIIGDIHHFRLKVDFKRLLGKRLLGQSNLWFNRRFRFNHSLLDLVIERTAELQPDLVLLTGDVTTTSLEDEFSDIVRYFEPLAQTAPVLMVPGNHDRYTFRSAKSRRVETIMSSLLPRAFPHHQKLSDRWHLLGLDSARPQVVFSRGELGQEQFQRTAKILESMKEDEGVLVLCHYPASTPPGTPRTWAHDMAEGEKLDKLLEKCPARVVFVHGHIHKPWHWIRRNGQGPHLTCVNAGAPCMTSANYPMGQGFWELQLPDDPHHELHLTHHVPTPDGHYGTFGAKGRARHADATWQVRRVV